MRLLTRILAVVAACAVFPAANAACTAATIKGSYAAGISGSYSSTYPIAGVGHVYFNGVNGVAISSYKEGEFGDVRTFTGSGTYQLDPYCRGTAAVTLKQNGVTVGTLSFAFTVSGTAASPQIQALISNPASDFTGGAFLSKINL
jgi:hypothetical protein